MDSALLIGSDTKRLKLIFNSLSELGWQIKVITQPQNILQILDQTKFKVFFCDEPLKGASAGGLNAIIQREIPEAQVYLFRASTKAIRSPKPFKDELSFPPVRSLLPKPQLVLPDGTRQSDISKTVVPLEGNSSMVSLVDIILAICMDKRASVIDFDRGKTGLIYLNGGRIEHAIYFEDGEATKGLKALGKLTSLQEKQFRVLNYKPSGANSINLPGDTALTEAARLADEDRKYSDVLLSLRKTCPSITDMAIGYPMSSKPTHGYGNSDLVFGVAKNLLDKMRETIKGRLNEFFLSTDSTSYALTHLDEGNLLIASAPSSDRIRLQEAIKHIGIASYA